MNIMKMTLRKTITALAAAAALAFAGASRADAQAKKGIFALSTNIPDYIALGTMNLRADVAVHQHWSIEGTFKYNPWTFRANGDPENQMQNRNITWSLGPRYWFWNYYAGWFIQAQAQYQQYNRGGIWDKYVTEADAFGGGVALGYTYLISGHWNIEFGLGVWAGVESYNQYNCPRCGRTVDSGTRFFVMPNDILVSIVYIF